MCFCVWTEYTTELTVTNCNKCHYFAGWLNVIFTFHSGVLLGSMLYALWMLSDKYKNIMKVENYIK